MLVENTGGGEGRARAGLSAPVLGGCRICDTCAKRDNLPCRYPDKALPSLESYGVDVYRTTEPTPLKYINGQNTVTFFGMVLFTDGVEQAR